jgi:hypothetical protein
MYAQGRGAKADLVYAFALVTAASTAGDKRGDELQTALEHHLSAAQLREAKKRAAAMQTNPPITTAALAP